MSALFENRSRVLAHESEQKLVEAKLQLVEAQNKSERLKAVVEAAHFLLVSNNQDAISVNITSGRKWNISHLHPGTWNKLTEAERGLWNALAALEKP